MGQYGQNDLIVSQEKDCGQSKTFLAALIVPLKKLSALKQLHIRHPGPRGARAFDSPQVALLWRSNPGAGFSRTHKDICDFPSRCSPAKFRYPFIPLGTRRPCQMPPPAFRAKNHYQKHTVRTSHGCMCRKPSTICRHRRSIEVDKDEWVPRATGQCALLAICRHRVLDRSPGK